MQQEPSRPHNFTRNSGLIYSAVFVWRKGKSKKHSKMSSLKKQAKQRKRKQTKEKKKQTEGKGIYASLRSLDKRNKEEKARNENKGRKENLRFALLASNHLLRKEGRKGIIYSGRKGRTKGRTKGRKQGRSKAKRSKAKRGREQGSEAKRYTKTAI